MLCMYSPELLPSRWRAAVAKNRIWSTAGGISSLRVRWVGLPVFSTSRAISSSARASTASAKRKSISERSLGVLSRYVSYAAEAAFIALSMSASPDSAAVAYCSPVAGLTMAVVRPSAASTYWPLMKFLNAFMRRSPCCRCDGVVVARSLHCEGRFDLDLSDYGTQHELALGSGDTTLGFQPADERIETARAGTVDDHRVVRRPSDVQRQLDLVAARQ